MRIFFEILRHKRRYMNYLESQIKVNDGAHLS